MALLLACRLQPSVTMKTQMKTSNIFLLLLTLTVAQINAQTTAGKKRILIDISHGQKFWNDPARMDGMDVDLVERLKYMTGEVKKSAAAVDAEIGYVMGEIKGSDLAKSDLLFIHIPSTKYGADEVDAIRQYLQKGGSLFLVMDANYWSTLQQTNVNDIIKSFGVSFGEDSPDTLSGAYTKAGPVTSTRLKIPFHGGRIINGGTPFSFNIQGEKYPHGTFTSLPGGGKLIVMGDGMVSLYMNSWQDVTDYQCGEFMNNVFAWLVK
jgi:hypothetical protein